MDTAAEKFVDEVVADAEQPLVVFALEWCEFCWSVRKFLQSVDVEYRTVDLDSVAFQENNLGRNIREVLAARTSFKTIPQIFIGGEFIGGCTDFFDAWKDGSLQQKLAANGISFAADKDLDPYKFLPGWLHPR
jgi:cysteine synthase A